MSISSLTLSNFSRSQIQRVQSQLVDAQKELNTGRHADVGKTLGQMTGNAITYRGQESSISSTLASNKLIASRFDLMDDALTNIHENADTFSKALINGTATGTGVGALITSAKQGLQQTLGSTNLNISGQYLFAGTQSDVQPVSDGPRPPSTPVKDGLTIMKERFDAYLGSISKDATTVSPTELSTYLNAASSATHSFSGAFEEAFPASTSDAATARISKTETIETSASASSAGFRDTLKSYVMVASLGLDKMGDATRQALTTAAQTSLKAGQDGIVRLQADLGVRQNRLEAANTILEKQQDIVKASYDRLEGVDQTEASLLINQLKTQLEVTYSVTGKLQGLSILNYI